MAWVAGAYPSGAELTVVTGVQLNALANGSRATGSSMDNTSNKDKYADIFVHLDALTPTAGARLDLYILESHDGSTFPSDTAAILRKQTTALLCSIPADTSTTTAQDLVFRGVVLPPTLYKIVVDNQLGVAIPTSNNSYVKVVTYND